MRESALRKTNLHAGRIYDSRLPWRPQSNSAEQPAKYKETLKRTFDIISAICAIICLSPLLLATALAIKLDSPGPVIFRQCRIGRNNQRFLIYKFRTMSVLEDGPTLVQAKRDDRRVTRVGRLLRRSSIDELPQLLNVLKGDMSLIGPRPHAVAHDLYYRTFIPNYADRHQIRPGITGWAQINGFRGETTTIKDMKERVERDLWYIDNWSLLLDLRIALLTCREISRGEAY